ncbi:Secreted RxLR effector peptide protein [Phytophthora palmivora]|uniref:RxLR effector protein n=1 Tax=Phytophthora palmivora TaxID=4796 RepID=A0A2P4WYS4_9STRA|nr:Secreted RxLR effector peptide protein [Phytophthora palmivora]
MRLNYITFFIAAILVAGTNVASPSMAISTDHTPLSKVLSDSPVLEGKADSTFKRSLRAHDLEYDIDVDSDDEERGLLESLKFLKWFKKGMNPKKLYKKLGLEGLGENAWKHKNYDTYLKFSKYWRDNQ